MTPDLTLAEIVIGVVAMCAVFAVAYPVLAVVGLLVDSILSRTSRGHV